MWRQVLIGLVFVLIIPASLAESYSFKGMVTSADGALGVLAPVGTDVRALITVAEDAVSSGAAQTGDIEEVLGLFGGLCFEYQYECFHGTEIPIIESVDAAISFDLDGVINGGYLIVRISSPTFFVPIIVTFDFSDNTLSMDGSDLGVANAGGEYMISVLDDVDEDGVISEFDNCTMTANPGQLDIDEDGFGNACDPDININNDCVVNFLDVFRFSTLFGTTALIADFDGTIGVSFQDYAILVSYFGSPPGPSAFASCP